MSLAHPDNFGEREPVVVVDDRRGEGGAVGDVGDVGNTGDVGEDLADALEMRGTIDTSGMREKVDSIESYKSEFGAVAS